MQALRRLKVLVIVFAIFLGASALPSFAKAGVFELGASGSYRRQNIATDAVDESQSLTGSISYYLDEQSALELSYTDGASKRSISPDSINGHTTTVIYKSIGLDFIYTFGGGSARPYVKVGTQYVLEKRITDQYTNNTGNFPANPLESTPSFVPSAGIGFKIGLTNAISVKAGIDAWTSDSLAVQPVEFDYAARFGLSWMFQ
jgi:hypothetical protein